MALKWSPAITATFVYDLSVMRHKIQVLSSEQLAKYSPLGSKSKLQTVDKWPLIVYVQIQSSSELW